MILHTVNFTNYREFEENLYITSINHELYYEQNSSYTKPRKVTTFARNVLFIFER
jgi:hypothetical protein